jgi:hypothetical protein
MPIPPTAPLPASMSTSTSSPIPNFSSLSFGDHEQTQQHS